MELKSLITAKIALSRLDSPLVTFAFTTVFVSIFTFGMLHRSGFDASTFITAGDTFCDPAIASKNITVLKNNGGYDGQFYYRLALDPFTSRRTDFGVMLDVPSYRQQRILYPFLAWALSAGKPEFVPWWMLGINYIALCLLGWLGALFARTFKQHALWGIFLPLYPASLLTMTRDLVELLEVVLLISSLLALRRGKHIWGAVLLTLAALTKESALLVAPAAMMTYIIDWRAGRKERISWIYFTLPITAFLMWHTALLIKWGELPAIASKMNLGKPFYGFIGFLLDTSALQTHLQRRSFRELILLIIFTIGVVYCIRATSASLHEKLSWVLYLILALSFSRVIWVEDWAFLRAISEFSALGIIIVIGAELRARAIILGSFSLIWVYNFLRLLRHGD